MLEHFPPLFLSIDVQVFQWDAQVALKNENREIDTRSKSRFTPSEQAHTHTHHIYRIYFAFGRFGTSGIQVESSRQDEYINICQSISKNMR